VRSDWMAIERERGISVSSAVMSFEHQGFAFNLLDPPGQDFSEAPTAPGPRSTAPSWCRHRRLNKPKIRQIPPENARQPM